MIEDTFDDASLQEFINEKTNREIKFSYENHLYEGKTIGVICISPLNLKANLVAVPPLDQNLLFFIQYYQILPTSF